MAENTGYPGRPGAAEGRWPFAPIGEPPVGRGPGTPASSGEADEPPAGPGGPDDDGGRRRRPPLWLLIAAGAVVVGLAVVLVLLLANRTPAVLDPEMVTLPPRTPTIEPIEPDATTLFQETLPTEVLEWALIEITEHDPLLIAGALEGYRLVYSDGARELTVYAGQWRDEEGAQAAYDAIVSLESEIPEESEGDVGEPTLGPTESPTTEPLPEPEEGVVEVDGERVGSYLFVPRDDGTASWVWTNLTVLIQIDGPLDTVRDVYAAYPL